jgi:hypothetical protein
MFYSSSAGNMRRPAHTAGDNSPDISFRAMACKNIRLSPLNTIGDPKTVFAKPESLHGFLGFSFYSGFFAMPWNGGDDGQDRNFAPTAGFEPVDESNRERGGPTTMSAAKKPVLPVTVFTDYI